MANITLMNDITEVGIQPWVSIEKFSETGGVLSAQVGLLSTGACTATIRISGTNDHRFPINLAEFVLTGTDMCTDAIDVTFPFQFYRAEIVSITGTAARATCIVKV